MKTEAHLFEPHQRMEVSRHHTVTASLNRKIQQYIPIRLSRNAIKIQRELVCAYLVQGSRMGKEASYLDDIV